MVQVLRPKASWKVINQMFMKISVKCEGTSGYIKSLKNHMKIAQEVNNQNCVLCGSSFETKGELKSHTSRIHEKITKKTLKIASLPKPN